jgi:hypothetical protein
MSLASIVRELQEAKRDANKMVRPECAEYLHDLIMVALEREIDSFIAFLGDEGDTIVSQKMHGAAQAREMVEQELEAFRNDPMAAYLNSNATAEQLEAQLDEAQPFERPEDWHDVALVNDENLILSMPGTWQMEPDDEYTVIENEDGSVQLSILTLDDSFVGGFDTESGRLFMLQTYLETSGYEYYSEWRAESAIYALNRGYLVEFARRYDFETEIQQEVWVVVLTPEGRELIIVMTTERSEFAQIDYVMMEEILKSIRPSDKAVGNPPNA